MSELETTVAGIPCIIKYNASYTKPWRGHPHECPSPEDYHGGWDIDYTVCDRTGRYAAWLDKKITDAEDRRIREEILEWMAD